MLLRIELEGTPYYYISALFFSLIYRIEPQFRPRGGGPQGGGEGVIHRLRQPGPNDRSLPIPGICSSKKNHAKTHPPYSWVRTNMAIEH